jgi:hypothetical protein
LSPTRSEAFKDVKEEPFTGYIFMPFLALKFKRLFKHVKLEANEIKLNGVIRHLE